MDTVILVNRGGLILRGCLISLSSMPKNLKQKVPCLVSFPNTRVNIVQCEFKGNEHIMTAGCLFMNSDVVMSSCKLFNFKAGSIFSVA